MHEARVQGSCHDFTKAMRTSSSSDKLCTVVVGPSCASNFNHKFVPELGSGLRSVTCIYPTVVELLGSGLRGR